MISFQNDGLIDPRCISVIGVSIKPGENPFGLFGTGLKYAIAIILRLGGKITIWRGTEALHFTSRLVMIRETSTQVIFMNDQELGFTTHLGAHWEVWQAFREIWCNTKDELGSNIRAGKIAPKPDKTTIIVELDEFEEIYQHLDTFVLLTEPRFQADGVEFHEKMSNNVYYRGIKVLTAPKHFRWTPNIMQPLQLTEDRTASHWSVMEIVAKSILKSTDARFLEKILSVPKSFMEYEMDLQWPSTPPSKTFLEIATRIYLDSSRPLNESAKRMVKAEIGTPPPVPSELVTFEETQLKVAIARARLLGWTVDEFPIRVVESLTLGVLGMADIENRIITISRRAIQMGDSTLLGTLFEEWAHIKHGYADYTPAFQNYLVDVAVTLGLASLARAAKD